MRGPKILWKTKALSVTLSLFLPLVFAISTVSQTTPPNSIEQPRILAPGVISTDETELSGHFSSDGKTYYFVRANEDWSRMTIYSSQSIDSTWGEPEVMPFSGHYADADPFPLRDGSGMLFASKRTVDGLEKEDLDLWGVSRNAEGGWGTPFRLVDGINSPYDETYPTVTSTGNLYFASNRGGDATRFDIYCAFPEGTGWGKAERLDEPPNSPAVEVDPFVTWDESVLLFAGHGHEGEVGKGDLFLCRRNGAGWSTPECLPEPINSLKMDFCPTLTPDGGFLVFSSKRTGNGDIYIVPSARWMNQVDKD